MSWYEALGIVLYCRMCEKPSSVGCVCYGEESAHHASRGYCLYVYDEKVTQ